MFQYFAIANEWDKLNGLNKKEISRVWDTIEDGSLQAIDQFSWQLLNSLIEKSKDIKKFSYEDVEKIRDSLWHSLLSGYYIFIAYQNITHQKRRGRIGIQYEPTLREEYNKTIASFENEKNKEFLKLLDSELSIILLINTVSAIQMSILRKRFKKIEKIPFKIGELIMNTVEDAVFIGFGVAFSENNLKCALRVVK